MENLKQREFGEPPVIINASESHMALVFVLDTSGSMGGPPIDSLNRNLNRFKDEVIKDKQTRDILDVAIIEFNTSHRVVQEFVPVEYMDTVNLVATGGTTMSPAIREALKMVDERSRFYRRSGSEPYKPWVFLVSDGAPGDNITAVANEIKAMETDGKVSFRSLGVPGYDMATLRLLSGEKVLAIDGADFASFFNWVAKSMRSVSQSSPGEKPQAVPVEGNVQIPDWD
jgi:uncharacterized protein YegL